MKEKRNAIGYYNYTVVLTYMGMLAGFTGILCTMEGAYRQAIICLMTAGICDMFDGTVAATKQRDEREKRFGIQIDSLSDLICFGVLPGVFTYSISEKNGVVFMSVCAYVLCALIRLAYFNVCEEERQQMEPGRKRDFYMGLPVTTAALILPFVFMLENAQLCQMKIIMPMVLSLMAAAFVMPVQIKKPYLAGKIGILFTGILEFVILVAGMGMEV